ncbi:MAG: hypothetical protein QXN56_05735 [Candidatus Hadarchaeum sp.]
MARDQKILRQGRARWVQVLTTTPPEVTLPATPEKAFWAEVFWGHILLSLVLGLVAALSRGYLLDTQHHWSSFEATYDCLKPEPIPPPKLGCLIHRPWVIAPWVVPRFFVGAVLFWIPWEIARFYALRMRKTRLFQLLSAMVLVLWLPWSGFWWEAIWWGRWPGVPGPFPGQFDVLDVQWWNSEFSFPWVQLVPVGILLNLLRQRLSAFANDPPVKIMDVATFRLIRTVTCTVLAGGILAELAVLAADGFFSFPQNRVRAAVLAVVIALLHLLSTRTGPALTHAGFGGVQQPISDDGLKRALTIFGKVLITTAGIAMVLRDGACFPLDVAVSPRGQKSVVCPFLSTGELTAAIWILLGGLLFSEAIKFVGGFRGSESAFRLGLAFQVLVVFPLAAAVSWGWLHAGGFSRWDTRLWELNAQGTTTDNERIQQSEQALTEQIYHFEQEWDREVRAYQEIAARAASLSQAVRDEHPGFISWILLAATCAFFAVLVRRRVRRLAGHGLAPRP